MQALVVVDLGFGDAGKGMLTDALVRRTGATVVVRYNGGAQAGHNVVTPDGRHHTFAQFGAGTFVPGVRTFLSRHMVVHPTALLREGEALEVKGVADAFRRIRLSERAPLVTPFHQALNRLRELARGAARHGSCGAGVGETVRDLRRNPDDALLAGDLLHPLHLRRKLGRARDRLRADLEEFDDSLPPEPRVARERSFFEAGEVIDSWVATATRVVALGLVAPDGTLADWLAEAPAAVFEGAQGLLLDEWHGFHPFTTWSSCTTDNALALIAESAPAAAIERIGILRAHAVRHGPGPLPTETDAVRPAVVDHNLTGEWQGPVRYGWFDAVLARYALEIVGRVDRFVLTHLDVPSRLGRWRLCSGYGLPAGGRLERLAVSTGHDLDHQARLTDLLFRVEPLFEECPPEGPAILRRTEALLDRTVDLVSRGSCATDLGGP